MTGKAAVDGTSFGKSEPAELSNLAFSRVSASLSSRHRRISTAIQLRRACPLRVRRRPRIDPEQPSGAQGSRTRRALISVRDALKRRSATSASVSSPDFVEGLVNRSQQAGRGVSQA